MNIANRTWYMLSSTQQHFAGNLYFGARPHRSWTCLHIYKTHTHTLMVNDVHKLSLPIICAPSQSQKVYAGLALAPLHTHTLAIAPPHIGFARHKWCGRAWHGKVCVWLVCASMRRADDINKRVARVVHSHTQRVRHTHANHFTCIWLLGSQVLC